MQPSESKKEAARDALFEAIEHLAHVLPGKRRLKILFITNTLHGYQKLSFFEALKQSHETTGAYDYMPQAQFLEAFQSARVSLDDLQTALQNDTALDSKKVLTSEMNPPLKREDIFVAALCRPFKALTSCQLNWEMEECSARTKIQQDVDPASLEKLLKSAQAAGINTESEAIADLWAACLEAHGLEHYIVPPEELVDLTPDQAEAMLALVSDEEDHAEDGALLIDRLIRKASLQQLHSLLEEFGDTATLRSFLLALTGHDLLEDLRPMFQRLVASHLDLGWAALHSKDRSEGLYAAWHRSLGKELAWVFDDAAYWKSSIELLPDDPLDAIIGELTRLGVAQQKWGGYLQRLALEMPGWSGQYFWRHSRPGYDGSSEVKVEMIDYLAVRLSMEHLFAQKISQDRWKIEPGLDLLRWLFRHYPAEFFVRYHFYNEHLPDYLVTQVQPLVNHRGVDVSEQFKTDWEHAAHLIWTWQHSQTGDAHTLRHRAWPLFRLAQHLGLSGGDIRKLDVVMLDEIFDIIDNLDDQQAGYLRLQAYERNYREKLFNAVANNRGRGRWRNRKQRPKAQVNGVHG